ncbi:MAG: hypothetical protein C0482_27185 [Gordonia sp.]|nr:hypothetical protein [Gordonia sp. (in: high G+C Gram-positive bacteria)]
MTTTGARRAIAMGEVPQPLGVRVSTGPPSAVGRPLLLFSAVAVAGIVRRSLGSIVVHPRPS